MKKGCSFRFHKMQTLLKSIFMWIVQAHVVDLIAKWRLAVYSWNIMIPILILKQTRISQGKIADLNTLSRDYNTWHEQVSIQSKWFLVSELEVRSIFMKPQCCIETNHLQLTKYICSCFFPEFFFPRGILIKFAKHISY